MDNLDINSIRHQTKYDDKLNEKKAKKRSNTDLAKNTGVTPGAHRRVTSSCFY